VEFDKTIKSCRSPEDTGTVANHVKFPCLFSLYLRFFLFTNKGSVPQRIKLTSSIKAVGRTMVVNAFVAKYNVVKLEGTGILNLW
jgi:hypothetical protein